MLADITAALSRGDHAAAIAAARTVIAAEPENAEAHHLLGLALRRSGDLTAARDAIDQAIALAPEVVTYQLGRASLALAEGDLARAENDMKGALQLDPNQLPAYASLVHLALAQDRIDDAERLLQLAQRVDAEHPQTLVAQGQVAQRKGDNELALKCFTKAVVAQPADVLAQISLGLAYLQREHFVFAEQALRRASELDPGNAGVLRALLEACRRQQKAPETVAALDGLLALKDDPALRATRAKLLFAMGRRDDALRDLLQVLDVLPTQEQVLAAAVEMLAQLDRAAEAVERVERALALDSKDAFWALRMQVSGQSPDAMLETLERWAAAQPESAWCLDRRAHFEEVFGNTEQAGAFARQALAHAPGLPSSQLLLIRAELVGDPQAALSLIDEMESTAGKDPGLRRAVYGFRGVALDRLQRYAEASDSWLQMSKIRGAPHMLPMPAAAESVPAGEAGGWLLWAPPGVRIERVLGALSGPLQERLLLDRPGAPQGRLDGFGVLRGKPGTPAAGSAARWREPLVRAGLDPTAVVDWLPHFDAYTAAALPGAETVAFVTDPRDTLLNWLAFGNAIGLVFLPDPVEDAKWLARCLMALADHRDAQPDSVHVIALDDLASNAPDIAVSLQAALCLDEAPDSTLLARPLQEAGGLAIQFPAGHWRHYREALAAPFAELAEVAQRLGYPAE